MRSIAGAMLVLAAAIVIVPTIWGDGRIRGDEDALVFFAAVVAIFGLVVIIVDMRRQTSESPPARKPPSEAKDA